MITPIGRPPSPRRSGGRRRAAIALAISAVTAAWLLVPGMPRAADAPGGVGGWRWSSDDDTFVGRLSAAVRPRDDSTALLARLDARAARGPSEWWTPRQADSSWPPLITDLEREDPTLRLAPGAPTPTPAPEYYTVVAGDTFYDIAESLGVDPDQLATTNHVGDGTLLSIGQRLVVPPRPGAIRRVVRPSRAATLRPRFLWPAAGAISTYFGELGAVWLGGRHSGLDIAAREGEPIAAAERGRVLEAGWSTGRGYGNYVLIDHGMGIRTLYGHMSKIKAEAGKVVNRGELIGYIGDTGVSFGPHLHFEVLIEGVAVDPLTRLP